MRHPLVPPLLVVLALVCYAVIGAVAVGSAAPAPNATVTGTVTDDDGRPVADAAVVLEPTDGDLLVEHTDGERAVVESLLKVAETDPDGVTVVHTDGDGRFTAAVPEGRYRVVAVTRERVSPLRDVDATGGTTVDLTVDRHRVLRVESEFDDPVAPGNTSTVTLRVANPDDEAVGSLSVVVGDLPAGWTVAGVDTAGSYDADARRLTWERVPAGGTASATLQVRVPADAAHDRYRVPLAAESASHFVEHGDVVTVVVRPANATPTPTSIGADLNETGTPPSDGDGETPPSGGDGETPTPDADRTLSVPGFGAAAALGGLVVALALATRRR